MKASSFSDAELKNAAALVRASMLDSLSDAEPHSFSSEFQRDLQTLLAKEKRGSAIRGVVKCMAAACLALVLGAVLFLAINTDARAAVLQWLRQEYADRIVYHYFGEIPQEPLPVYEPTWVPEGYVCVSDEMNGEYTHILLYQMEGDANDGFALMYYYMHDNTLMENISLGDTPQVNKQVEVNTNPGEIFLSVDGSASTSLFWMDEDAGIAFALSSNLDESVIMRIAESVKLSDSTK